MQNDFIFLRYRSKKMLYVIPVGHLPEHVEQLGAVSRPLPRHGLHRGEQQLELAHRDAVAGQHPQQLHQQVRHDLQIRA